MINDNGVGLSQSGKATYKQTKHFWPTIPNIIGYYMLLSFAHPVTYCCVLLRVVAQSLKPVKLLAQKVFASVCTWLKSYHHYQLQIITEK